MSDSKEILLRGLDKEQCDAIGGKLDEEIGVCTVAEDEIKIQNLDKSPVEIGLGNQYVEYNYYLDRKSVEEIVKEDLKEIGKQEIEEKHKDKEENLKERLKPDKVSIGTSGIDMSWDLNEDDT